VERQLAQVVAAFNENIESAKLDFLVVFTGMQRIEIRDTRRPGRPGIGLRSFRSRRPLV
jgi:hypothetical protein